MALPLNPPLLSRADRWLSAADNALKTLSGANSPSRPRPQSNSTEQLLSANERRLSGALMRVNHVGEVCAQALYSAQALATHDAHLQADFTQAARDETDHLAWTQQRLRELNARTSLLNPFWYAASFGIGWLAGHVSDRWSLGFIAETERQVEQHLAKHLDALPASDHASRVIVQQMKDDEARHALAAEKSGATVLPLPIRWMMRGAAKVMTTTAHYI